MSVRSLDALLGSAVFWGIVSVVLFLLTLLFGSRMQGIAKAIVLAFALLTGSYGLFRWWSEDTPQDWRLLASLLFLYSGAILLIYFWTDLQRAASRPVNGEPIRTGKPVASASMFDVGGLPTHEVIPDPPDWVEPATKVNLIFQDSPLLTDRVKDQITRDLSAFREYFLRLGIPVPIEFPAIGVSKGPGSSEAHVLDALPPYRSNMKVAAGWFLNRRSFTEQYAHYMLEQALTRRIPQHPEISGLQDMMAASASAQYYKWSFWDYKPTAEGGYWSSSLWEIRSKFGKDFGDRLVAFAIKSIIDNPEEGADPNFDTYFHHKLQQADAVIDTDQAKIQEITAIIQTRIDLTTRKAYFNFAATAVKKYDGTFEMNVIATNKSDVPANRGQFHLYFAPDVRLVKEPTGSSRDSTNTLRSARLIPFESIAPHSTKKIRIEFAPSSDSFPDMKFFLLNLASSCETCGNDNFSHSLKFVLEGFDSNR